MPNNTMLYRHPGPHKQDGISFEYVVVLDEEIEPHLKDGWALSSAEAKVKFDAAQEAQDSAPPTRAELEEKAKELGLKFDGRTTDKKLAAMIAEKV